MIRKAIEQLTQDYPHFKVVGADLYENIFIQVNEPGIEYKRITECTAQQKFGIPTKNEIESALAAVNSQINLEQIMKKRISMYINECNILYIDLQYEIEKGVKTQQELDAMKQAWIDKVPN